MKDMQIIIWLFPVLFIFHDFEEIIFVEAWWHKNRLYIKDRFPKLSKKLMSHFDNIKTASFALAVAEEFIIISVVTIVAYITNWHYLWIGLFIAFTLHLIVHCFQFLIVRKYIPTIVTSLICLPVCIYITSYIIQAYNLNTVILYSAVSFIVMIVNLIILHKLMDRLKKWFV